MELFSRITNISIEKAENGYILDISGDDYAKNYRHERHVFLTRGCLLEFMIEWDL